MPFHLVTFYDVIETNHEEEDDEWMNDVTSRRSKIMANIFWHTFLHRPLLLSSLSILQKGVVYGMRVKRISLKLEESKSWSDGHLFNIFQRVSHAFLGNFIYILTSK